MNNLRLIQRQWPLALPSLSPPDAHRYLTVVPLIGYQRYDGEVTVCIGRGSGGDRDGIWCRGGCKRVATYVGTGTYTPDGWPFSGKPQANLLSGSSSSSFSSSCSTWLVSITITRTTTRRMPGGFTDGLRLRSVGYCLSAIGYSAHGSAAWTPIFTSPRPSPPAPARRLSA